MGIIVTIEYTEGNVFLQLSGKTEAVKWLPLLLVERKIAERMLLADGKGGMSLVISEEQLPGLLEAIPGDCQPEMQKVGLVEITGYSLRSDAAALTAICETLEESGISVIALSASDTDLTVAVPDNRGTECLRILENRFNSSIE